MATYQVDVIGCDDTTSFDTELSADELPGVVRLVEACVRESNHGCQPVMRLSSLDGSVSRWVAGEKH